MAAKLKHKLIIQPQKQQFALNEDCTIATKTGAITIKQLPEVGYLRLPQIIGDTQRNIPAIIPVSRSAWWAGVKAGRFPQAFKLGPRTTVWRVADVLKLLSEKSGVAHA